MWGEILSKELLRRYCVFSAFGVVGVRGDAISLDEPSPLSGGDPEELAKDEGVKEEDVELEMVEE
jgi:hypothetical protein